MASFSTKWQQWLRVRLRSLLSVSLYEYHDSFESGTWLLPKECSALVNWKYARECFWKKLYDDIHTNVISTLQHLILRPGFVDVFKETLFERVLDSRRLSISLSCVLCWTFSAVDASDVFKVWAHFTNRSLCYKFNQIFKFLLDPIDFAFTWGLQTFIHIINSLLPWYSSYILRLSCDFASYTTALLNVSRELLPSDASWPLRSLTYRVFHFNSVTYGGFSAPFSFPIVQSYNISSWMLCIVASGRGKAGYVCA